MSYFDNIRTFVRVYELGSMSKAGRDLRLSPAVTSSRISSLEQHLGTRLFQRTTRELSPTEQGHSFYPGALKILSAINQAEAKIIDMTEHLKGSLYVAAPLGLGRRLIAPHVGEFLKKYPDLSIRLRLSDRKVDLTSEGLDLAFFLGNPEDSNLTMRKVADVKRLLCASPEYIARRGMPETGDDLVDDQHECLSLRFPGAKEFRWQLKTRNGLQKYSISGHFESDDGDVLTDWALSGHGIIMKPVFEVINYLQDGSLVPVAVKTPPESIRLACLFSQGRMQDPKIRLFMEFMIERIAENIPRV